MTFDSIPVSDYSSNETPKYVRRSDIKVVQPMEDGTLDVIYALPLAVNPPPLETDYLKKLRLFLPRTRSR